MSVHSLLALETLNIAQYYCFMQEDTCIIIISILVFNVCGQIIPGEDGRTLVVPENSITFHKQFSVNHC